VINLFHKSTSGIAPLHIVAGETVPEGTLWIDIMNPTLEEERSIENQLKIAIPSKEEVWKNEVLNRFYNENGVSYMTAALITKADSPYPQTSAVTFILTQKCLVTIRYINPTSFHNFSERMMRRPHQFSNGAEVMEGLLEEIITRVAHNSEVIVQELDSLSHNIFGFNSAGSPRANPSQMMQDVLRRLGTSNDLNSKINESLHSLQRLLSYFREVQSSGKELGHAIRTLYTDVQALTKQTDFLADKIIFQMDATLGMINVEQNMIIKIFSVVAVFFLPPTLVSSIYGMNFRDMPELTWQFGYPIAVGFMVMCAVVPFLYFRKKGWL